MSVGKQRIYEKMYSNFYKYVEKLGLNFLVTKNSNSNNSNNNNNKNNMDIIIPGHYQSKLSLNAEKPEIIRVLGPDNEREEYWLTQDGKSIPGYALLDDYVLLDMAPSENFKSNKPPKSIFAGLGESKPDESFFDESSEQPHEIVNVPVAHKNPLVTKTVEPQIKEPQIKDPQEKLILDILNKLNIDDLNQKYFEKYQVIKYKKPVINFLIPIELNFEIEKLKNAVELLNLDKDQLLTIVLNFLIDDIELTLIDDLKPRLEDLIFGNIEPDTYKEEPPQQVINTETTGKILPTEKISPLYLKTIQKIIPVQLPNGNTVIGETVQNSDDSLSITVKLPKNEFNYPESTVVSSKTVEPVEPVEPVDSQPHSVEENITIPEVDLLKGLMELRKFVDTLEKPKSK